MFLVARAMKTGMVLWSWHPVAMPKSGLGHSRICPFHLLPPSSFILPQSISEISSPVEPSIHQVVTRLGSLNESTHATDFPSCRTQLWRIGHRRACPTPVDCHLFLRWTPCSIVGAFKDSLTQRHFLFVAEFMRSKSFLVETQLGIQRLCRWAWTTYFVRFFKPGVGRVA